MKESITKFDLESAFKALNDIETPSAEGIKANRPALTEIFSHKSKFDYLIEEYYDVSDSVELDDAKEAREAEVAKAKLARIEKIVDLDADSPEDLLTSYVGKYIIQCPQCMTLFYKNPEDVVEAEEDPTTVNVNEICQHCGNESGYTLIGKVGEADAGEFDQNTDESEIPEEGPATEETSDETAEEPVDSEELGEIDLDALDLNLEDETTEKTEEAHFVVHSGETLVEEVQDDAELDAKLNAHNEYIEYLRNTISQEEKALEQTNNVQVKDAIQRRIDALRLDLDSALPDAVKTDETSTEEPAEAAIEDNDTKEPSAVVEESCNPKNSNEPLTESLCEEADSEVSAEEFEELIGSPEFKKPISDSAVRAMINAEKESEETVEESLEEGVLDWFKDKGEAIKNTFFKLVDNILKTRSGAADWVFKNALKDYSNAKLDKHGNVEASGANRKYNAFSILEYPNADRRGQKFKKAPRPDDLINKLTPEKVETATSYASAEKIAKGWSSIGNGPAAITLTGDEGGTFLCMFYEGQLDKSSDKLKDTVESVRRGIAGGKSMAQGRGAEQEVQTRTKKIPVAQVKADMKIKLKDGAFAEIVKVEASVLDDNSFEIELKLESGDIKTLTVNKKQNLEVLESSIKTEGLKTLMTGIEELQESSLEQFISSSLVESYGNVAGYRLTNCEYLDEKLLVTGSIYFTSGNTRNTTYTFTEAFIEDDKVKLCGLNEKLGLDKKFTLIGRTENRTLITESFSNK